MGVIAAAFSIVLVCVLCGFLFGFAVGEHIGKLEGRQESQEKISTKYYIRFGDIPEDECSCVWSGGGDVIKTEKGVSVYDVFIDKTSERVMGAVLPIPTNKTTFNTFRHIIEYENRPCYLVSGDYVGKGTDGEPLIQNVKIIKEIKYK